MVSNDLANLIAFGTFLLCSSLVIAIILVLLYIWFKGDDDE